MSELTAAATLNSLVRSVSEDGTPGSDQGMVDFLVVVVEDPFVWQ